MKMIGLPQETMDKLWSYITSRPYSEVEMLVGLVQKTARPVEITEEITDKGE